MRKKMKSNTMIRLMAMTIAWQLPAAAGLNNPDWSVTR